MAEDNKGNKGSESPQRPKVPTFDHKVINEPTPFRESNNEVSNTLKPKTGNTPPGRDSGKK
jgi:hypothetical protein